jgi:hypothetical protein
VSLRVVVTGEGARSQGPRTKPKGAGLAREPGAGEENLIDTFSHIISSQCNAPEECSRIGVVVQVP